ASTSSHTLGDCSHMGRSEPSSMPALFTKISMRPRRCRVSCTIRSHPASLATDSTMYCRLTCLLSDSTSDRVRATPIPATSRRASAMAVWRPMPRPAPVTIATLGTAAPLSNLCRVSTAPHRHLAGRPGCPAFVSLGGGALGTRFSDSGRDYPSVLVLPAERHCLTEVGVLAHPPYRCAQHSEALAGQPQEPMRPQEG